MKIYGSGVLGTKNPNAARKPTHLQKRKKKRNRKGSRRMWFYEPPAPETNERAGAGANHVASETPWSCSVQRVPLSNCIIWRLFEYDCTTYTHDKLNAW